MVCIRKCHKCGIDHIVGEKCPKPLTTKQMLKWVRNQLKVHRKADKEAEKGFRDDTKNIYY